MSDSIAITVTVATALALFSQAEGGKPDWLTSCTFQSSLNSNTIKSMKTEYDACIKMRLLKSQLHSQWFWQRWLFSSKLKADIKTIESKNFFVKSIYAWFDARDKLEKELSGWFFRFCAFFNFGNAKAEQSRKQNALNFLEENIQKSNDMFSITDDNDTKQAFNRLWSQLAAQESHPAKVQGHQGSNANKFDKEHQHQGGKINATNKGDEPLNGLKKQ